MSLSVERNALCGDDAPELASIGAPQVGESALARQNLLLMLGDSDRDPAREHLEGV